MKTLITIFALSLIFAPAAVEAQNEEAGDTAIVLENLDLENLQKIVSEIRDENVRLQERLLTLEGEVNNDNFNTIIRTANHERFKSDISVLQKRYEAGENVLYHIIRETNNFNLSYKHLALQSQFNNLFNPMNYPGFANPLKTTLNSLGDKKPLNDIDEDLSNLASSVPYLANPMINSGISIVSYFLAKFNKKSKIDNANFEKMMCVLNFTTTAQSLYRVNVATVTSLSDKIDNYNTKLKNFFDLYLRSVGYSEGYETYVNNKATEGNDFLDPTRQAFFDNVLGDTSSIGVIGYASERDDNVSYYIEQVKFHLNEYEALLLDIENSILRYEEFVTYLSDLAESSCEGVTKQTEGTFSSIQASIAGVKKAFNVVNKENRVPAGQKKILFGL